MAEPSGIGKIDEWILHYDHQIKIGHVVGRFIGARPRTDDESRSHISLIRRPSPESFNEILHRNRVIAASQISRGRLVRQTRRER
jgi:hypothetical protein